MLGGVSQRAAGITPSQLMYRVNYSQREESISPRGQVPHATLDLGHIGPAACGQSVLSLSLSVSGPACVCVSLSWILVSHWFWLNSQRSNFVLSASGYYHFTFCNCDDMCGFSRSFLRNLRHGKTTHFILFALYFDPTSEALFIELGLINALDETTKTTQVIRVRPDVR